MTEPIRCSSSENHHASVKGNYQNKYNLLECSHHNLLPLVKDVLAGGYGSIYIVPVVYLYDTVFGGKGNANRDAGAGAAVGVILALIIVVVYFVMNRLLKDDDLEF